MLAAGSRRANETGAEVMDQGLEGLGREACGWSEVTA